eukprot:UN03403
MSSQPALNLSSIIPQDYLKQLQGERISVLTLGNIELEGVLRGYDDYCNLLLDDVVETTVTPNGISTSKIDKIFLISMRVGMITRVPAPAYETKIQTTISKQQFFIFYNIIIILFTNKQHPPLVESIQTIYLKRRNVYKIV